MTRKPSTQIRRFIVLCWNFRCCSISICSWYNYSHVVWKGEGKEFVILIGNYNSSPSPSTLPAVHPFLLPERGRQHLFYILFYFFEPFLSMSNLFLINFVYLFSFWVTFPLLLSSHWTTHLLCIRPRSAPSAAVACAFLTIRFGIPFHSVFFARSPHLCPI